MYMFDEGENFLAKMLFGDQAIPATLYLGLYKNNYKLDEKMKLADMIEPGGSGYSRIPLSRGSWTVTNDQATYAKQTLTAGWNWGKVCGYFIATSPDNSGKLLIAEEITPVNLLEGATVDVTPKLVFS